MGAYTYLPYCIVFLCVEYLFGIKVVVWWTRRENEKRQRNYSNSWRLGPPRQHWLEIFDQRSFQSCASGLYGRTSCYMLLCTRLMSCLFFVIIGMGFNFSRSEIQGHWQFFTNWNVGLISGYYTLTCVASAQYLKALRKHCPDDVDASDSSMMMLIASYNNPRWQAVGTFLGVYFSVASVTAFFVTTVNFLLLDPAPHFFNLTAHLFTSLSFIVEISLNSMEIKKNEIVLNMSWVMLWLAFIWPIVWLGIKPEWPYDFMDSSTPIVFLWYQVLIVVYFVIFFVCNAVVEYKLRKFSNYDSLSPAQDSKSFDRPYRALISEI